MIIYKILKVCLILTKPLIIRDVATKKHNSGIAIRKGELLADKT